MQPALAVLNAEFRSELRPDRFFDCYCDDCCDKSRALDSALAGDFDPNEISNDTWDWLCTVNVPGYFYLVPLLATFVDTHVEELGEFVDCLYEDRLDEMSLSQLRGICTFVQSLHQRYVTKFDVSPNDDWITPRIELLESRIRDFER